MKTALKYIAVILVSLVLGVGSALWVLFSPPDEITIENGPWRTMLVAGSKDSGMYTRGTVALIGLLALKKSEAVYYVAKTDQEGRPLRSACDYRVEGKSPLPARWWSITLYGAYTFFIPNKQKRYSYNDANVAYGDDGNFTIHISQKKHGGNWLPSGDEKRLHIALRLYNPDARVYKNPAKIELPRIVRGKCR